MVYTIMMEYRFIYIMLYMMLYIMIDTMVYTMVYVANTISVFSVYICRTQQHP
jgi:hypothetical protein